MTRLKIDVIKNKLQKTVQNCILLFNDVLSGSDSDYYNLKISKTIDISE